MDALLTSACTVPLTQAAVAPPLNPDAYLNDPQTADLLGVSPGWLRQLRLRGGGPQYAKLGRAVRYRVGDILAWANSHVRHSTSEAA